MLPPIAASCSFPAKLTAAGADRPVINGQPSVDRRGRDLDAAARTGSGHHQWPYLDGHDTVINSGLIRAVDKFDCTRGCLFSVYATR